MDFREIIKIIREAFLKEKAVEIYYSKTENNPEGWRKIRPESITTDIPPEGEKLVVEKDRLSPGHILNAYDLDDSKEELKSFIIGKIKQLRHVK